MSEDPIRATTDADATGVAPVLVRDPPAELDVFWGIRRLAAGAEQSWYLALLASTALLIAGVFAWDARYEGDPDGLAYQDIAQQLLGGNTGALSNPYWSPLYPVLNAVLIAIFRPKPENVLPTMHAAGVVMFALATLAFVYFIRQWTRVTGMREDGNTRFYAVTFFGWCIYLWVSLRLVSVVYPLPDMLTLACILTAAGMCCRITAGETSGWRYGALGFVLGVGYLGKFAVAPMSALLFATMWALAEDRRRILRNLAVSGAVFVLVAAPLIGATSHRVGRLSLGEAGHLNFAWHVNTTPFLWTGPGGFEKGETRVRVVSRNPLVYEFTDQTGSTMPVWYDPAYWHAGLRTHFDAREVATSVWRRIKEVLRGLEDVVPLLAGVFVLLRFRRGGLRPRPDRPARLLGVWGLLICCPFLLVHVEFRYIAGGVFLICLAGFRALERAADWNVFHAVTRVVGLAMLTTLIAPGQRAVLHAADAWHHRSATPEHVMVAQQLRKLGLQPGDAIAMAGYGMDVYFAPIVGVRVLAQVCDSSTYADLDWHDPQPSCHATEFLRRDPSASTALWERLRRDGIKAIVTHDVKSDTMPAGWHRLGETRFWARLI